VQRIRRARNTENSTPRHLADDKLRTGPHAKTEGLRRREPGARHVEPRHAERAGARCHEQHGDRADAASSHVRKTRRNSTRFVAAPRS